MTGSVHLNGRHFTESPEPCSLREFSPRKLFQQRKMRALMSGGRAGSLGRFVTSVSGIVSVKLDVPRSTRSVPSHSHSPPLTTQGGE